MASRGAVTAFVSRLVLGPDRKLRVLWRAVIFLVLADRGVPFLLDPLFGFAATRLQQPSEFTAANVALNELENFVVALVCTAIFALYERRRVDSYGLPLAEALGARTAEGAAAGVLMAGAVAAGMWLLGGMQIRGFATTGSTLALAALAWLGTNVLIGVAEEFWFRSYLLQSLWKSIGFWPASIVIALLFAADHYFFKTGENVWDVITLVSLSLLMCYSVLRTGTLWFAVGFHISFDYMQLFVIGTPNGARLPQGRLLEATFDGPAWLTGGALGTEASFLMYPMIALLWLYIGWRFRADRPAAGAASGTPGA
ncbi:MAG: CPBP family intramembrane metalloprotease [Gammaproteobacteria bacterium]|nr:MAG: CPBP family intramembrane metalloprotease [Gammaproteobacteria bacterium]